jgi:protease-4
MYDSTTGFTAEERAALKKVLEYHYRRFVADVAKGRKKGFEEIEAVAQGRVWSGADALKVGLVDSLGGMASAVTVLKDLARVSAPLPLRPYPPRPGFWDLFWKESSDELVLLEGGTEALLEQLRDGLERSGLLQPLQPMALLTFRWTVR